jgi:hypothetical protein
MNIKVKTQFLNSETVRIIAEVKDDDDKLAAPTAITVNIYDPNATQQVTDEAMTLLSTGLYEYYYHKGSASAAMTAGKWRGDVSVADGTGVDTIYSGERFSFKVE